MARARDCHKHGHTLKQSVVTVTATQAIEIASMLNHAGVPPDFGPDRPSLLVPVLRPWQKVIRLPASILHENRPNWSMKWNTSM